MKQIIQIKLDNILNKIISIYDLNEECYIDEHSIEHYLIKNNIQKIYCIFKEYNYNYDNVNFYPLKYYSYIIIYKYKYINNIVIYKYNIYNNTIIGLYFLKFIYLSNNISKILNLYYNCFLKKNK